MYVARGSALLFNDGSTYPISTAWKRWATRVSPPLVLAVFRHLSTNLADDWLFDFRLRITTKTPLGRYIYAIGGNESPRDWQASPS